MDWSCKPGLAVALVCAILAVTPLVQVIHISTWPWLILPIVFNAIFEDQFLKLWLYPLQLFWWSIYKLRLKLASFFNSREDNQCDPHQLEVVETWFKYRNQQNNPIAEKQFQDSCMYIYPEVRYNNITIELWKPKRSQTIMFSENTRGLIYRLATSRPSWWYIIGRIFTTVFLKLSQFGLRWSSFQSLEENDCQQSYLSKCK